MSTPIITIKRSSFNDEEGGYPVTVSLRGDHAILTVEEAEQALKELAETIKEAKEASK